MTGRAWCGQRGPSYTVLWAGGVPGETQAVHRLCARAAPSRWLGEDVPVRPGGMLWMVPAPTLHVIDEATVHLWLRVATSLYRRSGFFGARMMTLRDAFHNVLFEDSHRDKQPLIHRDVCARESLRQAHHGTLRPGRATYRRGRDEHRPRQVLHSECRHERAIEDLSSSRPALV